jgi:hypothetical protein
MSRPVDPSLGLIHQSTENKKRTSVELRYNNVDLTCLNLGIGELEPGLGGSSPRSRIRVVEATAGMISYCSDRRLEGASRAAHPRDGSKPSVPA